MKDGNVRNRELPTVPPPPEVGDWIYLRPAYYVARGRDDVHGGKARVIEVKDGISGGQPCKMVVTEQVPWSAYNWDFLGPVQENLRQQFGDTICTTEPS